MFSSIKHGVVWVMSLFVSTAFAGGNDIPHPSIVADLGACKFKMSDVYGGTYEVDKEEIPALFFYSKMIKPKARRPLTVDLKFVCVDPVTDDNIADYSGGRKTDSGWVMSLHPDVESDTAMHNTFYVLRGKNWSGPGISQDVTNGEETRRTRGFGFCIPHGSAALCGSGDVAYLDDLKGSALREVIKMIETIEFVE